MTALIALGIGAGVAAVIDLRTGRIPNTLTLTLAALGVALATAGLSGVSWHQALLGGAAGFALMLPGHLVGGTGAGDVKLMAALGTWLGPWGAVLAFLYAAIAGGVLAAAHAWHRGRLAGTVAGAANLVVRPVATRRAVHADLAVRRFAYGPALALGAVVAAVRIG